MASVAQEMEIWKNLSLVDMPGEVWKPLIYNGVSYEGLYDASSMGRIKSLSKYITRSIRAGGGYTTKEKIIRQSFKTGYLGCSLYDKNGIKKPIRTHRAIGCTFIPNPDNKPEVNHKWGIKTDNRVEMLEWFTGKEQGEHAKRIGLTGVTKPAKPPKKLERVFLPPIEFTEDELASEEWRDVKGLEGVYKISNLGHLKSLARIALQEMKNGRVAHRKLKEKILKQNTDYKGYLRVDLSKDGIDFSCRINRLVAEAFHPNPGNLPEVHHIDRVKNNNRESNLKWITSGDNSRDTYINGRIPVQGEVHPYAKLTEVKVIEIREKWASGNYTKHDLEVEYGVSEGTIKRVVKRESWKHVTATT